MTLIDESILSNIADDYNNGLNTQQLSDKYSDFSPYIIRENLRIIGKLKRTRFSEEEINNICTDYNNGMSIEKISEKYGHPQETIKKKLKKYGLYKETRKYHTYTDKDIDIIKEYYPSGNWDMLLKLLPDKSKESIASKAYSLKIIQNNYQWNEHDVNDVLKRNGYILRSEFKGIREKHLISDLDGYLYYLSLTNFCYKDNYKPLKFSKSNIYSIENIKNYIIINNIDCKLLSETYVNNTSDLEWECHCGEKFLCPWCRFLSGKHQCNKCAEIESLNKISYSMDEIEEIISHKGYTLISETFTRLTNGFEAFDINGYHVKMTKDNVLNGDEPEIFHKNNPYTIENIKHYIELNNISTQLISTIYHNNNENLKWKCNCGKEFDRSWANFHNGAIECLDCSARNNGLKRRNSLDEIVQVIENNGFHLYDNIGESSISQNKFSIYDDEGYLYETTWSTMKSGKMPERFHSSNKYSIQNINNYLKINRNNEYECISKKYVTNEKPLEFRHIPCGCIFESSWNKIQGRFSQNKKDKYYKQCPNCNTNKTESNHASVLKQVFLHEYPDTDIEDKSCINPRTNHPLPTDIVNHRLKIAIEIQSDFHDREDRIPIDKFKKDFWIKKGYNFFDPDIRDYSILEMIQIFFPWLSEIPSYIDYNFSNCIDFNLIQDLLNRGYTIKQIHKLTGINRTSINWLSTSKKIELPDGYKKKVFNIKPIIRLSKSNEIIKRYETLNSICNDGFATGTVRRVLLGQQNFSYDSFWVYEEDYLSGNYTIPKEKDNHYALPVAKYNMNNELICTYNSIYDAEKDSVSNRSEIYRVAKGDRKSSRNEKWKFINVA